MKLTRMAAAAGLLLAAGAGTVIAAAPANAYPSGTIATATINATVFNRGNAATVNVQHATPGGVLTMVFESTPVVIASGAVVGADGTGSISGAIPSNAALGGHTITVNSNRGESFTFAVTVVAQGGGNGGNGGNGGSTSDNGNGGGLASTGAAVTGIGILGGVLVAGGVFFVVAGRRRTQNTTQA